MSLKNNGVKISILMPVFNDEEYLSESIDSIVKQTLKDIELICVNDGSTDSSLEILNDYSNKYDFIKVFTKENEGSGIARNYALTKATGEFIAYLDSDDIFINERALELMYDSAIKNNALMVSANLLGINIKGELVVNDNLERFSEEGMITPQEYGIPYSFYKNIFNREFLLENNIIFPDLLRGQDPVFLAEIFTLVDKIPTVPVDLYGFRYPKTGSLLKINTYRKKYDYIKHFKETFDILDEAGFSQMKANYEKRLAEFINAYHNRYTKEIKDIVYEVFKDDEDILNSVKDLFINPKISVIIPVYNASKFLHESIPSVLKQSLKEIELICVNDGSKDDSLEILNEFYQKDSRVRIIDQENAGCGAARNRALDEACGDYIYFFDPDDYIQRNAFKELYNNAVKNDSDLVIFKIARFREGEDIDYSIPGFNLETVFKDVDFNDFTFDYKDVKRYVLNSSFAPWTKLYKKAFLDKYDDFRFPTDVAFDDTPFHVQSMLRASKMSFIPKFFYHYRLNPNSINNTSSNGIFIFDICDIVERFLKKENYFDEFVEEFKLFKITQINNYMLSTDSEDYFQRAKKEYSAIDLGENHLVKPALLKRYNFVLESDSLEEYKSKEYEVRIREYIVKRDNLKKENRKLIDENNRLKKELSKQKDLNKSILSSSSWKITKHFRKFTNVLRKIKRRL
ncbi:glycosyltransferase [Methanobrevibacter sp.]|uniref:glycosyltransferase family 2 protein n=1 Tax=Methanobrevibacter sp. TaxID=66852 RepID=UPI0025E46BFE|nr:glycosyltransferase [Methanobrevibacter sp.]MBQ2666064.1 glycosyltransferase [Methanobrevibacter sp.]